jgi:hypothetical protein
MFFFALIWASLGLLGLQIQIQLTLCKYLGVTLNPFCDIKFAILGVASEAAEACHREAAGQSSPSHWTACTGRSLPFSSGQDFWICKPQGWKKPGFFLKKHSPVGFFGFFGVFRGFLRFFGVFCPEERVFRVFSVSRILLGASRL